MPGLEDDRFAFRTTKDGRVFVERHGRTVTIVAGEAARRLIGRLADADPDGVQQLLARATGNYKRGNERPDARGNVT